MLTDIFYDDEVVGRIRIRKTKRANHIRIQIKNNEVILSIPQNQKIEDGIAFLQTKRSWILTHIKNKTSKIFDENVVFQTFTFELKIEQSPLSSFHFKLTPNLLTILYPENQDVRSENSQSIIRMGIERAMRMEAKRVLPKRLAMLAEKHQFQFNNVNIRSSKTRWGSCSSRKDINLSYFLMTLPVDLIDYVLLHELCHTKEMNHSSKFWELMDYVTNNQAKKLQSELKKHKTSF